MPSANTKPVAARISKTDYYRLLRDAAEKQMTISKFLEDVVIQKYLSDSQVILQAPINIHEAIKEEKPTIQFYMEDCVFDIYKTFANDHRAMGQFVVTLKELLNKSFGVKLESSDSNNSSRFRLYLQTNGVWKDSGVSFKKRIYKSKTQDEGGGFVTNRPFADILTFKKFDCLHYYEGRWCLFIEWEHRGFLFPGVINVADGYYFPLKEIK